MNEKQLKTIKGAKYRVITDDDGVFDWGAIIQLADNPNVDAAGAFYIQEGNSHGRRYMYFSEIELVELQENAFGGDVAATALTKVEALEERVEVLEQAATSPEQDKETPEPLYAVGQKLRVKGNGNPTHHHFKIGTEVEVAAVNKKGVASGNVSYSYDTVSTDYTYDQIVSEADLEPAPQPHISEEEFATIKVGDKIVLRSDLATGNGYGKDSAVTAMVDLAQRGVEIKVEDISSDDLRGHAEGDHWWYTHKMIAKVIPAIKPKFKVGDIISIGHFFLARKITAVDLENGKYKWVWADGTTPEQEHTNSIEAYDSKYTLHSSFEKPKPKFQVGDVLNRSGASTDMGCARLIIEVDEENSEYCMQWAGGFEPERRMTHSFKAVEENFIKVEGLPPRMINPKGTVITAGSYYAVEGTLYDTVIRVNEVQPKNTEWAHTVPNYNSSELLERGLESVTGSPYFRTAVPATSEQIAQFKKLENSEPAEENAPEFDNPEVEVGKVYMDDDGWMFYCDDVSKVEKHVFSNRTIYVNDVTSLNPAGELRLEANFGCSNYREATPEEAIKLLSAAFQDKAA